MAKQTVEKKDKYDELYSSFKWEIPKHYNFGFDVEIEFL